MKKILFTLVVGCFVSANYAQQIKPYVVNSAGGTFSNSSAGLHFSVGETAIIRVVSSNGQITQGFLQPNFSVVSIKEMNEENSFSVFPNPTNSTLNIKVQKKGGRKFVKIIDCLGRLILEQELANEFISVADFNNGIYHLMILNEDKKVIERKIITKTN